MTTTRNMLIKVFVASVCVVMTISTGVSAKQYRCLDFFDDLQEQLDKLDNQTAQLQNVDTQQGAHLAALDNQQQLLQNRAAQLESADSQQQGQIAALQEQVRQLREADIQQQAQTSAIEGRLDTLQAQYAQLQALVGSLQNADTQQQALLSALQIRSEKRAAFSVRFDGFERYQNIGTDPIRFNIIVTNDGNGYNPQTGEFTAAASGLYVFYFHMRSSNNKSYTNVAIHKNGTPLMMATADGQGNPWNRGNVLVTTQLNAGDRVSCKNIGGSGWLEAGALTQFSGILVYAM